MAKKSKAQFVKWFGSTLDALRELGGSGSPSEVSSLIAEKLNLPEEVINETIKSGASKFHNQVCWARQYLVWEGYIDASVRGIWKLTNEGAAKQIDEDEARKIFLKWVEINATKRKKKQNPEIIDDGIDDQEVDDLEIDDDSSISVGYKEQVIQYLRKMHYKEFESFCLYLLRVNGFENPVLTGGSHDEGIDGIATLRINPFVSFKVIFQAKRYKEGNNIGRSAVGDFRNAMIGRADKGIFITTSKFTSEAIKEANREGAPQIELVDSEQLIRMMELSNVGLRPVTTYEVDHQFFKQYVNFNSIS
ncbi:MAG: restriction endonuclease [Clostridia bacterium]